MVGPRFLRGPDERPEGTVGTDGFGAAFDPTDSIRNWAVQTRKKLYRGCYPSYKSEASGRGGAEL